MDDGVELDAVEVDLDATLQRVDGDREIVARIIDFITEDSPRFLAQIGAALRALRLADAERAAHSLHGLVSNVTCRPVQDKALQIQALVRAGQPGDALAALPELGELVERMNRKLAEARREFAGA
jgi:HPt (histidine-containing phosphotransfer) domain-containing protein